MQRLNLDGRDSAAAPESKSGLVLMDLSEARRNIKAATPPTVTPPAGILMPSRPSNPYRGASVDRLTGDWRARLMSADIEARGALITLRARCRELVRNDVYARRMIGLIVKNVIGARGIQLEAKLKDDETGGPDPLGEALPLADETNAELKRAWKAWARRGQCTVDGKMTFDDVQRLAMRIWATDGECFLRKVRGFKFNQARFALQFVDADRVDANFNRFPLAPNTGENEIRMGVEVDEWRRPVAYWITKRHPGEGGGGLYHDRVPASEILHFYNQERAEQTRGIPLLSAAMFRLHQLGEYESAELTAARVAACMMGFIKTDTGDEYAAGEKDASTGETQITLSPGGMEQLPVNTEVQTFNPQHPNAAYPDFIKTQLHGAAAGADMSHATATGDLREVNFSSIRQGVLDERDTWRMLQTFASDALCQPVFEAWLDMALLSKQLQIPVPSDEEREEICAAIHWQARGWTWVDPLKDVAAALDAVGAGMMTLEGACSERGLDWREVMDQRAVELAYAKKKGLDLNVQGVGATPKTAKDFGQPGVNQPGEGEPDPAQQKGGGFGGSRTKTLLAQGEGRE